MVWITRVKHCAIDINMRLFSIIIRPQLYKRNCNTKITDFVFRSGFSTWTSERIRIETPQNSYITTEKSFRNLINSNWNQIVFTTFRLIWCQNDVLLVPNQSENGKYNSVFLSILNQMELHLVQNRKENCHHDYTPFNMKGIGGIVFSV